MTNLKRQNFVKTFAVIICLATTNFSALSQTYSIVGTGVINCYNNSSIITCPTSSSDPFYGQFHGISPSYQNNGDGTISDLNTGLMWIQARGTKISWDSAFIMAAQCNTGGYNDWRVPTIKELYSLMNFTGKSGQSHPTCIAYIDTTYFGWTTGNLAIGERIIDAQDWSATKYTSLTMMNDTTIFGLNTVDGRIKGYPKYQPPTNTIPQRMHVRYVRGNTNYGINNFTDNADSTITDNATGLMWAKYDSHTDMNWEDALAWAQTKNNSNYCGHNDWRLPNAKELQSIVDYTRSPDFTSSAAIDPKFNCTSITDEGGNINYPFYWSSTTHLDNMGGVYVAFGEALGWMKIPPTATFYTLMDVHGAGAQRSDLKNGDPNSIQFYLGLNQAGDSAFGRGPQGDVQRINNFVRLVRDVSGSGLNDPMINPENISLFPNPANEKVTITIIGNNTQTTILNIFNMIGQMVYSAKMEYTDSTSIDIHNLPRGIYTITVETTNTIFAKKFVKE